MKNIARAFVVLLALTGATVATQNSTNAHRGSAITAAKATAFPIPTCPLNDPNGCGIAGPNVVR